MDQKIIIQGRNLSDALISDFFYLHGKAQTLNDNSDFCFIEPLMIPKVPGIYDCIVNTQQQSSLPGILYFWDSNIYSRGYIALADDRLGQLFCQARFDMELKKPDRFQSLKIRK